jgi:TM2 domain-containing membrane protein YozV
MMTTEMANTVQVPARAAGKSSSMALLVLIAGWLIPGAGHFLLGKWVRGLLLFVTLVLMFSIGIALHGKIYSPNTGDLLDILNFAGDLGTGLLYVVARTFDLGAAAVVTVSADYGTKFVVVAGLLNVIAAVDAHSLATGRKAS